MNNFNLINGNVITGDKFSPHVKSITINNGKIKSINSINPQLKSIDLAGATVIPGFTDSHFHLKNFGKRLD